MTHGADASTPDDVFLFAILDLRDGMVFAKDALGHRENVTIGGINGVLEMPSLPNREGAFDGSLVPPEAARTWKRFMNFNSEDSPADKTMTPRSTRLFDPRAGQWFSQYCALNRLQRGRGGRELKARTIVFLCRWYDACSNFK